MNKYILFCLSILFLASCNNSAHYAVLQKVDSLMNKNLDSAYTLIRSLNSKDLSTKDNAYYSLLLTTTQYKKSEPIHNDSIIDIAVNYYTDHFDQDKLTRALMYKGGVLADLNYNKLALESYKEAEKIADTLDFMTMGLLNFRMGELYQRSFVENDEHIKRYKQSLNYFHKANHESFENSARSAIGQLYSTRNYDSAYVYLNKALKTAEKLSDKQQIAHCSFTLSKFYDYHNRNITEAKNLALIVYNNRDSIRVGSDIYTYLSMLYSKLNIIDSALNFYNKCPEPQTSIDTMRYFMMQEELALARNDYKTAYDNYHLAEKIADSLAKNGKSEEYYSIDKQFDNTIVNDKAEQLRLGNIIRNYMILAISLSLILVATCLYFLWRRKKRIAQENSRLMELENSLKDIISNRMQIMRNIMTIKYECESKPEFFLKRLENVFYINKKSGSDCDDMINITNQLHNGIIDYITVKRSDLSSGEKLLLCLVCMEFSNIEIKVFIKSPSMDALYATKSRLHRKLNVTSLEGYINNIKSEMFMIGKLNKNA